MRLNNLLVVLLELFGCYIPLKLLFFLLLLHFLRFLHDILIIATIFLLLGCPFVVFHLQLTVKLLFEDFSIQERILGHSRLGYLRTFNGQIQTQYKGKFLGWARQPLISMPVRHSHKSCSIMINILFKVDTGTPFSYLTTEALQKLYQNCPGAKRTFRDGYNVTIAGHYSQVQEFQAHYQTLNILGAIFQENQTVVSNSIIQVGENNSNQQQRAQNQETKMMNYEKFDSFITYRITQKYKNEATQISQQNS